MAPKPLLALACAAVLATAASAQVLPTLPDVTGTVGGVLNDVERTTTDLSRRTVRELREAREVAARQLLRRYPNQIDTDPNGAIVVRNEVVTIAPTQQALDLARSRGFSVGPEVEAGELGLRVVVLRAPQGMTTREAVEALRALDPAGAYDFNHLYLGAGDANHISKQARSRDGGSNEPRIGLIDSGVDVDHRALAGVSINQRGFAGDARVGAHGTAIASLIAGRDGGFHGAAPGATLFVADVYGGRPTGGGASSIIAAMNWLVQQRAGVINVSLVGPNNRALEAAVRAAIARGHIVVAAVGNDGPAAAPLYPAAYPGVVGVTGVDGRNRVLPEAGRGAQVDFAAPGSDFAAASPTGGYAAVRGTSYAAPIVAGLIAREGVTGLTAQAVDLGARGSDQIYGAGLVGADVRDGARRLARR